MRNYKGGFLDLFDYVGDCKSFTRTSYTKKGLRIVAEVDPVNKLLDCFRLIARRTIF